MNLAPSDREAELAGQARAAFECGDALPVPASFTETCILAAAAGRAAPDRRYLIERAASLLGWTGASDVAVAFDVRGDRCDHVGAAATASILLVADPRGSVSEVALADARLVAQPTIFDPDACRVELFAGWRDGAREHDVGRARSLTMVLVAADCAGAAAAALEAATDRVAVRPLRDGVLADLQVVRHRIADMAIATTACWDAVLDAAGRVDRGEGTDDVALAAVRAKAVAVDLGRQVTVDGLRLAGGIGILDDHPWQRWYRRVKAAEPMLGSPRDHRAAIGRASLARFR